MPLLDERRQLGHSAARVTALGFGGGPIGNLFSAVDPDDAAAAVEAAWDAGIRYFDTAPHYGAGLSERRLGAVLQGFPRAEFTLSTKVGRRIVQDAEPDHSAHFVDEPDGHRVWDFSADGVRRSLEESLQRLGLDHVDVALIHDPDSHWEVAVGEAYPALHELRRQGVVKAIGAGMNQSEMLTRFVRECDLDCVLVAGRYTLIDPSAQRELLPQCAARGVSVIAAGVLNSGVLADPDSPTATYDYAPATDDVRARARAVRAVCADFGVSPIAAALQFAARHPAVATVLVGLRSTAEVADNVAAFNAPVPEELWAWIEQLAGGRS